MTKNEIALQVTLAAIEKGTITLNSRHFEKTGRSESDCAILLAETYADFFNAFCARLEIEESDNKPRAKGHSEKPANF